MILVIKKIKRKIIKLRKLFTLKYGYLKTRIKINYKWYGNNYGGFNICPELLTGNSIVYSFGIGEDISFDINVIENHNCKVYGFDPTPKSIEWVKGYYIPTNFIFFEYGISNKNEIVEFYLPINKESDISGSLILHKDLSINDIVIVPMKTISTIIYELGHTHIDVLKMDIEGAEYNVIENILETNISITQILIEFHGYFTENGKNKTKQAVKKLKKNGFEIFAVSETLNEISFINKNINRSTLLY